MRLAARGLKPVAELAADRPHGDRLRYLAGCRCFHCRRSNSDYERQRQAARAAGNWNGIVDAGAARAHLVRLSQQGVGRRSVAAATDIAESVLTEIRAGRKTRIRARTARKILAVTTACRADGALVQAKLTHRQIERLLEEGYTKRQIAKALGYVAPALQLNRKRVTARNAARVAVLYRRLTT